MWSAQYLARNTHREALKGFFRPAPFSVAPLGTNLPQHPIFEHSQRICSLAYSLKFVTNWSLIIVSFNTHNRNQCSNHSRKPSIKTSVSAWKDRTRQMNTNYCPCKREISFFWVIALFNSVSERNATVFKAQDVEFAMGEEQLWQVFYDTR